MDLSGILSWLNASCFITLYTLYYWYQQQRKTRKDKDMNHPIEQRFSRFEQRVEDIELTLAEQGDLLKQILARLA